MSASHLTMLGIPAYKSRTLIPDHLFLDPREYIYKWSVVSRVKNVMWHVLGGNKYDWTKSWGSAIANVQQLFVLLILYLSMNTDRKCWTLWDMNFRFGDNLFSLSSKCQDSYTIQSRHHADQSPATDLTVHQYTYWELDWIGQHVIMYWIKYESPPACWICAEI